MHNRTSKAIQLLQSGRVVSALDIGSFVVRGESMRGLRGTSLENLGLSIAADLVRRGVAVPTRGNQFRLRA